MSPRKYFIRTGKIYGVSSKYLFGWQHYVMVFDNFEDAVKWLHTNEYDFRERELMSKTAAISLAGRKAVYDAIMFFLYGPDFSWSF